MVTVLPLTFTEDGLPTDPNEQAQIITALQSAQPPISDLWIFSHGWNNSRDDALHLYNDECIPRMQDAIAILQPEQYNPLYVGVIWPSKGWADFFNQLQPATDSSASSHLQEVSLSGAHVPIATASSLPKVILPPIARVPISKADFLNAYAAFPLWQNKPREQYMPQLGELYDYMSTPEPTDADIEAFFKILQGMAVEDPRPESLTRSMASIKPAEGIAWIRNYHAMAQQSGSQQMRVEAIAANQNNASSTDAGNWFDSFLNVFRVFTFWQMKNRAGVVGTNGVYAFLVAIKQQFPQLRVHLLGHSFGGRLVSAAVYNITQQSPLPQNVTLPFVNTLITLEGAFSQFAFTKDIPIEPGQQGTYNPVVEQHVVAHPLVAIYSQNDTANRVFYPLGMSLYYMTHPLDPRTNDEHFHPNLDLALVFVPSDDQNGAIGANGVQGLEQNKFQFTPMQDTSQPYTWGNLDSLYCINIDGQEFIRANDFPRGAHNDINHVQVFLAALSISLVAS